VGRVHLAVLLCSVAVAIKKAMCALIGKAHAAGASILPASEAWGHGPGCSGSFPRNTDCGWVEVGARTGLCLPLLAQVRLRVCGWAAISGFHRVQVLGVGHHKMPPLI